MDLWSWVENIENDLVEAGQAHSARIISDLSSYCADQEVEKVDALLPEAKALCQTLDNPWLSVFVGHWEMRHRLGNKSEGEKALADAVALFELAHREETQDCPQSVCVTQDLASCYSLIDGKGWAEERIAVSEETMAQIDPSWSCYKCLSCEKALAMLDQDKPKEAMAYLNEVTETLIKQGGEQGPGILETQVDILLALGEYEEALASIKEQEIDAEKSPYKEWKNISQPRDLQKVNALSRLKRDDEAFACLPPLRDVNIGNMHSWLSAIYPSLMRHRADNTWQLGRQLHYALTYLSDNGAHRRTIEMADMTVRLAVVRGARWSASQQLQLAKAHLPKLRIDGGAQAILDKLQHLIDDMPSSSLPVPADELLAWLSNESIDNDNKDNENTDSNGTDDNKTDDQIKDEKRADDNKTDDQIKDEKRADDNKTDDEITNASKDQNADTDTQLDSDSTSDAEPPQAQRNPEQEVEWLLSALEQRANDADLCIQAMNALQACGAPNEGIALMWSFIERQLSDDSKIEDSNVQGNNSKNSNEGDDKNNQSMTADDDAFYNFKLEFLDLLIDMGDNDGMERLAHMMQDCGDLVFGQWCLARQAYHNLDWEGVNKHADTLLKLKPDSIGARVLLARSFMQQQRFDDAAREYKNIIEALPEESGYQWDYLTAVTAAEDWTAMRKMANTLGMEMAQNDEPPSEDWGWVILRFIEQGDIKEYYGKRTSPVSAVVVENSAPNSIQHVADHVVFDASILTTPPEDPVERENYIPTFAVVHTLEHGDYKKSVFIDGVHPGEEALQAFESACEQNDYKLWIYSTSNYKVTDSQNSSSQTTQDEDCQQEATADGEKGTVLLGIMMFLAPPTSASDKQTDAFLTEHTGTWQHKVAWLNLAREAKVNTQPHEEIIERYGL